MMKVEFKEKVINSFWSVFFSGMILISILGGISRGVFNNAGIGYYINYALWISLWLIYILKEKKFYFSKEYIVVFCFIIVNTFVGALWGKYILNLKLDNLHQGFLIGLTILTVMGINWSDYLGRDDVLVILKVIFCVGIVASIYALTIQNESLIGFVMRQDSAVNAWTYRAFFDSRNVFAYFCFLSSVAGMYLLYLTKQKKYLFGIALLALQIYITDSRTALLILILFYALCLYFNMGKFGKIFFPFMCLILFVGIVMFMDTSVLIGRFYHESNTSFGDSGFLRLNMWRLGMGFLLSNKAILFGLGFGSQVPYLVPKFNLGSFHNVYMDILFQGGFVLLGIYLYMIVKVIRKVLKGENKGYKYISISFLVAFLFGSLFDSSAMLFSSNYEAVLSTLMVCVLTKAKIEISNVQS